MKQLLLVFLGGGLGSVLRFLIVAVFDGGNLPIGTFAVNVAGSLLMGFFIGLGLKQEFLTEQSGLLLVTGFCGGFTTFSAFSLQNTNFLQKGDFLSFGLYAGGSLFFCVLASFVGLSAAKLF